MMHPRMAVTEFRVDDEVLFIETDTVLTIRQYNAETGAYQVQRGDDEASLESVSSLYLEYA